MNPSKPNPIETQCTELPSLVGESRNEEFDGMFDVATTIERLCTDGTLDFGPLPMQSEPSVSLPIPGQVTGQFPQESMGTNVADLAPTGTPSLDILSTSFLQSVVNQIALASSRPIGLLVTSKSGTIIQLAQSGWDESHFRIHRRVLAKVAKESAWRPSPRFSADALDQLPTELVSDASSETEVHPVAPIETSACLNELANIIATPVCAIPFALPQSTGVAVFLCGASTSPKAFPKFITDSFGLWISQECREHLLRQLDAWLIVQRCSWFSRVLYAMELFRNRPRWWMAPLAIACLALLAPIPYYPKRDCVFEPESKQYLSSPIQGRIASCEVRPGDRVEKGQLMARLDDDQLRRDLATAQAEYDAASKKRDAALATRAPGNSGLAIIEMNQASRRIESIEDQLRRLEIRATTTGIVVQGDWQRSIGMPLTLGQSLFEVAELESMTAEVRLLPSDLAQINVGDEVSVRSDASGIATFRGKISRIEPRATVIDDDAVFLADVVIRDPEMQLRPGMKATAQINAGWKSLGWYLFNRPFRWIANQWIW